MDQESFRLLREIDKTHRIDQYRNKNRLIPQELYEKLKAKRICDYCNETVNYRMEIHHVIPVSLNGSNEESNLKVACAICHPIQDKLSEPIRQKRRDWRNPQYIDLSKPDKIIKPSNYCDKCQKKFKRPQSLKQHNEDVHPQ